jgi:endoglucanase
MNKVINKVLLITAILGAAVFTLDACSNKDNLETTNAPTTNSSTGANLQSQAGGRELAFAANKLLAKSINYSGLEFPVEGDWTPKLEEASFETIKQAGFTAIRLPVKFSGHALQAAPYTLEPVFMARVDWAIQNATKRGLAIIVDMHHYGELMMEPVAHRERFLALWDQIARRYQNQPASVIFEIGNEPHGKLDQVWNEHQNSAIEVIRRSNPTRALIVGTKDWNSAVHLPHMAFSSDPNLIVTFHHYGPHSFTHQGAHWETPVQPTGVTWPSANLEWRHGWQSYPNNTDVALEPSGIGLTFKGLWSGLTLHYPYPASGVYLLRLKTDRAAEVVVSCHTPANDKGFEVIAPKYLRVETQAGVVQDVSISSCGNGNAFTDLSIQSPLEGAQPKVTFQKLELVDSAGAHPFALNAQELIRAALDLASDWGNANNRPMFMGEFGTYIKTDQASRERYTKFNREEADKRGISWAYFDFSTYFRVYELDTKTWQTGLLKALIP